MKFSKEQILCPFDDFNTKPNKFSSPPDEYPSLKITFSGDLILLEDMVKCACLQDSYDFSNIFEYIHDVYKESDLNIGVLEGPVCPNQNYSISNIYDGKDIKLNFPPEFITSIKQAGINLVTTCNNHSFDCGVEGLLSTIDCLTCENLNHVGTYRNVEEKTKPFVITIKGVRIGILAYTYGFNKCAKYEFVNKYSQHSRLLPDLSDAIGINKIVDEIHALKNVSDLVIALPHMGTLHTHSVSEMEKRWSEIFISAGVDLCLANHSHTIKPIHVQDGKLTIFSPGHLFNSFTEYDGDISAIVSININVDSKKVMSYGIIPIYIRKLSNKFCVPVPVHEILSKKLLVHEEEYEYVKRIAEFSSAIMLNKKITWDYFVSNMLLSANTSGELIAPPIESLNLDKCHQTPIVYCLDHTKSVCFIGDSITCGSENGGIPWYGPLISNYPNMEIHNVAAPGATIQTILNMIQYSQEFYKFDTYVIAIGCNDIRYRNPKTCAMNTEQFISRYKQLINPLVKLNKSMILVAPWISRDQDPYCKCDLNTKNRLYKQYSDAIEQMCEEYRSVFDANISYLNPNIFLKDYYSRMVLDGILIDHIHPSSGGAKVFSMSVIKCDGELK